ncbi:MAG: isoprenylcysteine carboxylmethyltransferase family protein [Actinomycetes bacterium]
MPRLELKVPPDVTWLLIAGVMWIASAVTPGLAIPMALRVGIPLMLAGAGVGIIVNARVTLDRAHTTWSPRAPDLTTNLVTSGLYRFSRNPIYFGMLLVMVGWAVALASPVAVVLSAAFVLYIDRFQIRPEERTLAALLGQDYRDYAERVRRWV